MGCYYREGQSSPKIECDGKGPIDKGDIIRDKEEEG